MEDVSPEEELQYNREEELMKSNEISKQAREENFRNICSKILDTKDEDIYFDVNPYSHRADETVIREMYDRARNMPFEEFAKYYLAPLAKIKDFTTDTKTLSSMIYPAEIYYIDSEKESAWNLVKEKCEADPMFKEMWDELLIMLKLEE